MSKKRKGKSNRSSSTTAINNNSSHVGIAADTTDIFARQQEIQRPSTEASFIAKAMVKNKRNKKINISKELANFLGRDPTQQVTRIDIVEGLWDYIEAKGLQNPRDKGQILLDETMKNIFRCKSFTFSTMNKYIGAHIHSEKKKKRKQNTDSIAPAKKKLKKENDSLETAIVKTSKAHVNYEKAKRMIRMATATTPEMAIGSSSNQRKQQLVDGVVWENLSNILNDPRCKDKPSGPCKKENKLLAKVTEYGITPYKFEVPLGNGVSDCVGHDWNNRLCVVEAKDMSKGGTKSKSVRKRRAEMLVQTTTYATYLSQATKSDVALYCFNNQDGVVALESLGIFRYKNIKHYDPRNDGSNSNDDNESNIERSKAVVGSQPDTLQGHVFDHDSQIGSQREALEEFLTSEEFLASVAKEASSGERTKRQNDGSNSTSGNTRDDNESSSSEQTKHVDSGNEKIILLTQLLQNEAIGFDADHGEMKGYALKLFDLGLHSREIILFAVDDEKRIEKVRDWNWMKPFHKDVFVRWIRSKWENKESTELAFVKRRRTLQTSCILKDR